MVEHAARRRSEANNQREILVDILRSELHAATSLMEHRERWWTEGIHNAESAVGVELGRLLAAEILAAQEANAQTTSLVETSRKAQNSSERSTLAALEQ